MDWATIGYFIFDGVFCDDFESTTIQHIQNSAVLCNWMMSDTPCVGVTRNYHHVWAVTCLWSRDKATTLEL